MGRIDTKATVDKDLVCALAAGCRKGKRLLLHSLIRPSNISLMRAVNRSSKLGVDRFKTDVSGLSVSLGRMLQNAQKSVPYYRDLVEQKSDYRELDLQDFPVLNKPDLQHNFATLISRDAQLGNVTKDSVYITQTSGSSGVPTAHLKSFRHDGFWNLVLLSRLYKEFKIPFWGEMLDLGLRWTGQPIIELKSIPGLYISWNFRDFRGASPVFASEYLSILNVADPTLIYGLPSRIMHLARICREYGIEKRPKVIFTSFEQLSDSTRKFLSQEYKCPVISVYGTAELGLCGWECSQGHMHFAEDLIIPEILDEDGNASRSGEIGRLVITSLKSRIMPLIRYDTQDLAVMGEGNCGCGRSGAFVHRLEGRETYQIKTTNQETRPAYRLMFYAESLPVTEYQIHQDSLESLRLVIPLNETIDPKSLVLFQKRVSDYLRAKTTVTVESSGNFVVTSNGKRNPFIQNIL